MTIVDKITSSIKATHGVDFPVYYHDEPTLDLIAAEMEFPCAVVYLITTGAVTMGSGQARETVSAAVFFVEPSEFDFDAVQNEVIIDRCKRKAMQWLLSLTMDQWLELAEVERTQRVYEQFDDIVTGYGVMARLTELVGVTGCETENQ